MAIVITGDVHEKMPEAADQRFTSQSEMALAVAYARIAGRHGLKVTLFVTGRAVLEKSTDLRQLGTLPNVELAGHGWDSLRPLWWHGGLNRLTGSPHGPGWLQHFTVRRTCRLIRERSGQMVRSWRNHAYRYDDNTPALLAKTGVRIWSDEVRAEAPGPYRHEKGLISLPINTLPDHEHLLHGSRTQETLRPEEFRTAHPPDEWLTQVCAQVESIVNLGGVATILAHPICMKIADDWSTFDRLCRFLSDHRSLFARETEELVRG